MQLRPPAAAFIPAATWQYCNSLLFRRRAVATDLRTAHALLLTSGLLLDPHLSLLSLNSLLRSLPRSNPRLALPLLRLMLQNTSANSFPSPNHLSFPFAIASSSLLPSLFSGAQLHALVFKNGLSPSDHFVQTALLRLYSRLPNLSQNLFDETPQRDHVHYDVLMNAYLRAGLASTALHCFQDMLVSNIKPDAFVLTTALTACAHSGALEQGMSIHRYIEREESGYLEDSFIGSALVSMYAKCGSVKEAIKVFDAMPERNTHMWATMVGAFAMHGLVKEAIGCLSRMWEEDRVRPDAVVILGVLTACAHGGLVDDGLLLLAQMESRYNVAPEHEHYSCAVDMLCRVGRLEDAMGIIRKMPMRPLASVWGSLLTGCRFYGNVELAEMAVKELQRFSLGEGDDEGVYVQLSNIYLNANRKDDARRIRKLIGSRGIKKTPACSVIEVNGMASSFVAGDQVHPLRIEIWSTLETLADHMEQRGKEESSYSLG
ncbi:putative pentatricopeptide repeat-containing protein At3g28640 [Typha angustifolia]|uniref:putative pentatricopeptide repeat-containing protein At3g28640 n=1 Tax=Typha angustifolia TaxID=59011 RepID=UPI003C2D353C